MENKLLKIKEKIKNFFDKSLNNKKDASIGSSSPTGSNKISSNKPHENLKMY